MAGYFTTISFAASDAHHPPAAQDASLGLLDTHIFANGLKTLMASQPRRRLYGMGHRSRTLPMRSGPAHVWTEHLGRYEVSDVVRSVPLRQRRDPDRRGRVAIGDRGALERADADPGAYYRVEPVLEGLEGDAWAGMGRKRECRGNAGDPGFQQADDCRQTSSSCPVRSDAERSGQ
jgi:hypothetical protein